MSLVAAGSIAEVLSPLQNTCGQQPGMLCRAVLSWTHSEYLASGADVLFAKPARILLIVIVAVLVRRLINRTIRRVVANTVAGQSRLTALRTRAPSRLWDVVEPTQAVRERRQQ